MKVKLLSRIRLLATPWTAAYQAPPSMGFSRQEYWSGVPLPSPKEHSAVYTFHILIYLEYLSHMDLLFFNKHFYTLSGCATVNI